MILDRGLCRIYRRHDKTRPGDKPVYGEELIHEGYYGELDFETSPRRPTEGREETLTAARVRILQNRQIRNRDRAELTPFDGTEAAPEKYRITRAFHGTDDQNGEAITDLTLEVYGK